VTDERERRLVLCQTEHETAVQEAVESIDSPFDVEVRTSRFVPDGKILVLDPAAFEELPTFGVDFTYEGVDVDLYTIRMEWIPLPPVPDFLGPIV
jgi:hypothetical protein